MKVHLYYAPYPGQRFAGEEETISPVRVRNPKSALVTLAAGARSYLAEWGVEAEFRIIDTQVDDDQEPILYKSFAYGPRSIECLRYGGSFERYDGSLREADIIGISNNFTNSAGSVTDFAKHAKAVNPRALVIAGGMDATARPEWYLDNGFDVVVQLEGEFLLAKIVEAVSQGKPLKEAVFCREYHGGQVVFGSPALNLDELPPMALDLVEGLEQYNDTGEGTPPPTVSAPFTCFESSRGCHRTCSFCATPMRGKYRFMSPAAVERHFAYFREKGIQNILFQEDNILSRLQRSGRGTPYYDTGREEVKQIFTLAREYGFSWEFANGLEFGKFLDMGKPDLELMEYMFWSDQSSDVWKGCYRVQIPLEFLGDDPTSQFNKLRGFEEELEILDAMLGYGVNYMTFNVLIGHDGDDRAAIDTYLRRSLQLKQALLDRAPQVVPYFNVFNRTLLPGTADFKKKSDRLEFDIERDPEVISVYLSPMNTEHLSYYQLLDERLRMMRELNGDLIDQYDGIHRNALLEAGTTQ
ncbi:MULTISPECIES: B12-binding domain-containing radical SAM protein [unclassified Streptomyces]|uniref:B12-binding domain-containing radical SAM protein n=1 Tax=unclassified Streptomyces TaxID=2593676 RepID=UPI0035D73051